VLIPGPLTNVMEEPAVELPLLDGPGISSQPGTNWLGNSVGNCVGSWYSRVLWDNSNWRRLNSPQSPYWSLVQRLYLH